MPLTCWNIFCPVHLHQRALFQQRIQRGKLPLHGAVVDQKIRFLCHRKELLQIHIDRGTAALIPQFFVRKGIAAPPLPDHLGDIVMGRPHVGIARRCEIKKYHRWRLTILLLCLLLDALNLLNAFLKEGFRLLQCSGQKPIELDPLHPTQRAFLIAGALYQYRNAQLLQLFPSLRAVGDHGIFHRKTAALIQHHLVVRSAVFPHI